MALTERLRTVARRWRVARYERSRMLDILRDERAAAHVKRQQEGIRDIHPGAAGI